MQLYRLAVRYDHYSWLTLSISVRKTIKLTLYMAKVGVCSEIHIKLINTLCGEKSGVCKY